MADTDMADALTHPHPEVPFAQVGDDTITALAQLATIFKNKFQKLSAPQLIQAPLKAAENKHPEAFAQPIITSTTQHTYQTRSQRPVNVSTARNTPSLPRVVTPMTGHAAYPRVPARTPNLSTRNLPQDDFWNTESAKQAIALGTNYWTNQHFTSAVVHQVTGKEMEYMALMKDPDLQPLWKIGVGNEMGQLFQSIRDIQGTTTCVCVELKKIQNDRQITYRKIVCDYKAHKKEK
jgi:hypothetical protein